MCWQLYNAPADCMIARVTTQEECHRVASQVALAVRLRNATNVRELTGVCFATREREQNT